MPTTHHINGLIKDMAHKIHDFETDTIRIALSNTAPSSETNNPLNSDNGILANVTQVSYANYSDDLTVDRTLENISSDEVAGVYTLDADNFTIAASGGALAPWRYLYIFNDSAASDQLIAMIDNGTPVSLADGESIEIQLDSLGILRIAPVA